MATPRLCSIPDCGKPSRKRGWCTAHYARWQRHGDPLKGRTPAGALKKYFDEVVMRHDGDDCLRWPYACSAGYGVMQHRGKMCYVSRVVCFEVYGPPPTDRHEAAHSCGRGHLGCVNPLHLSWKTPSENEADKLCHGTVLVGDRNPNAKLPQTSVLEIRSLKGKMPQAAIAKRFNICQQMVSLIHRGKRRAV